MPILRVRKPEMPVVKRVSFVKKRVPARKHVPEPQKTPDFAKSFAFLRSQATGSRAIVQLQADLGSDNYLAKLCLPGANGILIVNDEEIIVCDKFLDRIGDDNLANEPGIVRSFENSFEAEAKGYSEVTSSDKKRIVDYLDVTVEGYASTFKETTPADRDGDYINPDAFKDTLRQFKTNPVMLTDHENRTRSVAGSYTKLSTDPRGLSVSGAVSNAPGLVDIRFKLVEKHLKAFSIGGLFFFGDDYHEVKRINLFEISLVAVPANQDALFSVKSSLTVEDVAKQAAYLKRAGALTGISTKLL